MKYVSKDFPPQKPEKEVNRHLRQHRAASVKRAFAAIWVKERRYHRYKYFVETCHDGRRIFLKRPTQLNKGIDFQVYLERFRRRHGKLKDGRPSHDDIIKDLRKKISRKPRLKQELFRAVSEVFKCSRPSSVLKRHPRLAILSVGLPLDATLRILRWLFIEQDLTYWLGRGRNELMREIERRAFGIKVMRYPRRKKKKRF